MPPERASRRHRPWGILSSALLAAAAALSATPVWAESGRVDQVVGGNLRITFDTLWMPAMGYRPIRVQVVPLVPVTAPRVLTLEAMVEMSDAGSPELVAAQRVELLPGTTQVETTLSLPPGTTGRCSLRVVEDGQPVPGLAPRTPVPLDIEIYAGDVFPRVLAVSASPPDFGELDKALRAGVKLDQSNAPWELRTFLGTRTFAWRPRVQLPRRWIDYSGADVVCIALDDLSRLRAEDGEAFRALLDWTAAGGNLVVSGVGAQQQRLDVLQSLLGMKQPEDGQRQRTQWRPPDPKIWNEELPTQRFFETYRDFEIIPGPPPRINEAEAAAAPKVPPPQPSAEDGLFWLRPYHWGMVVALGPQTVWPGTQIGWRWMLNALGPERLLWDRRHGVSVIEDNAEFWNFLVPGVGVAPVATFEVLITLFVLAVGPVNYFLLRRARRLHLMVVTVPASAALATALLLAFGLVSDGLATRVRVRSVTYFDQPQGRALCWARLSYFAGMAPRGGLRFPADTMVIPYLPVPRIASDMASRSQLFEWETDGQWLRSGWIASRTPTQFLTLRTRPTTLGVEVVSAGGTWEVRNRLGARIQSLILRNAQGQYFRAADIEPGGARPLEPVEGPIRPDEFRPPSLVGPTPNYWSGPLGRRSRYRAYQWRIATGVWQAKSEWRTSLAESRLAGPVTQSYQWASDSKSPGLEPGGYVALVDRSPEVELGVASAREVAGFHLVLGRYADPEGTSPRGSDGPAKPAFGPRSHAP